MDFRIPYKASCSEDYDALNLLIGRPEPPGIDTLGDRADDAAVKRTLSGSEAAGTVTVAVLIPARRRVPPVLLTEHWRRFTAPGGATIWLP